MNNVYNTDQLLLVYLFNGCRNDVFLAKTWFWIFKWNLFHTAVPTLHISLAMFILCRMLMNKILFNHHSKKDLLNMSNCGNHLEILTFLGLPGSVSFSHFHRTRWGSSANAWRKASLFSGGNVSALIMEPMLKYMTPCSAPFK